MFESIRKALSLGIPPQETHHPASTEDVALWAAAQRAVLDADDVPGGYAISGQAGGVSWRVECGTPTRSYIPGMELRGGAEAGAPREPAVMVLGRALQEQLEGEAYGQAAEPLLAEAPALLHEEIRWLATCDEVAWEALPASFLRHYAVLSRDVGWARRWVQPALVARLMNGLPATSAAEEAGAPPAAQPLVLMLSGGNVYLRMSHATQTLQSLSHGVDLLTLAARAATKRVSTTAS